MSYFDEPYYIAGKLKHLAAHNATDANGQPYNAFTLRAAIAHAGLTPEEHYKAYGQGEKLNPNAYFNENEYLEAKLTQLNSVGETDPNGRPYTLSTLKGVIAGSGLTAAEHYELYGSKETTADGHLLNPSNAFDANAYVAAKLAQLQSEGSSEAAQWIGKTVAELVAALWQAGISPVTHYIDYGASEASSGKIPFVQTVPSAQRMPNDPGREANHEVVPTNYNPATPAPGNAKPAPVTKPADVAQKVDPSVSPTPLAPEKSAPVPGDAAYISPPANIKDTVANPVIPPSSADAGTASGNWMVVNPDKGTGTIIGQDGTIKGEVKVEIAAGDNGSTVVIPPAEDKPVDKLPPATNLPPSVTPDPDHPGNVAPPSTGGDSGGNGGGTGGSSLPPSKITASYDETTHTLTVDTTNEAPDAWPDVAVVMKQDASVDIKAVVYQQGQRYEVPLAVPLTGPCTGITTIVIKSDEEYAPYGIGSVDTTKVSGITTVNGAKSLTVSSLQNLTTDCDRVTVANSAPLTIDDDLFSEDFSPHTLTVKGGATVTLGVKENSLAPGDLNVEAGNVTLTLGQNLKQWFTYSASTGKDTIDVSAVPSGNTLFIEGDFAAGDTLKTAADGVAPELRLGEDFSDDAPPHHFDFSTVSIENLGSVRISSHSSGGWLNSPTLTLGAGIHTSQARLKVDLAFAVNGTIDTTACTEDMLVDTTFANASNGLASTVRTGSGADILIGSDRGPSKLHGGAGNDVLVGQSEGTELTGGSEADTFYFGDSLQGPQTITDFVSKTDFLNIFNAMFGGKTGKLTTTTFHSGSGLTTADDADVRFMYNTADGKLYYDADGNGTASVAVHVATFTNKPTLSAEDIALVDKGSVEDPLVSGNILFPYGYSLKGSTTNDCFYMPFTNVRATGNGGDDKYIIAASSEEASWRIDILDFNAGDTITFAPDFLKDSKGLVADAENIPKDAAKGDCYWYEWSYADFFATVIVVSSGESESSGYQIQLSGVRAETLQVNVDTDTITVSA